MTGAIPRFTVGGRHGRWAPAVLIGAYVVGVAPSLGQTLLETHAHRQTQTAYTAVLYAEHGINLMRPPLPILGPPGSIPQEFPIFQALSAALIDGGVPADMAVRLIGLAAFVGSAVLLYVLGLRLMGRWAALATLAAFMFNAHAWVYGRTSLIEYLATAGGIGFLYFATRWMDEGRAVHWVVAALFGALGVLVKITTGGFYLLPALLWRSRSGRWGFQRGSVWAILVLTVAIGIGWSAYAQGVREETPAAVFLSMRNQLAWFFGTIEARLDFGAWRLPLVALISLSGFGLILWIPMAVARAREVRQSAFILGFLSFAMVMPLVLFNLYTIHDYYWAAVAPLLAVAIGLGVEWLIAHWDGRWARRAGVGLAGAWVATLVGTFGSWSIIYGRPMEEDRALQIAAFVRDHSKPDDWVVLRGWGWNSTFLYYARRQGLAVPEAAAEAGPVIGGQDLSDVDLGPILSDPVFGPFIFCDHAAGCELEARP